MTRQQLATLPPELVLPGLLGAMGPAEPEQQSASLWQVVDDRLRGRWPWMIGLGLLLGAIGAMSGWTSTTPIFQSESAIRITPRMAIVGDPRGLPEHEIQGHDFYGYVMTQVQLMTSRRVLERALRDDSVAGLDFASSDRGVAILERGVEAEANKNSQLVWIRYSATKPRDAQYVVDAVVNSYVTIWGNADSGELATKMDLLTKREEELQRELRALRVEMERIHARHGAVDLVNEQNASLAELREIANLIDAANIHLSTMGTDGASPSEFDPATQRQLEMIDPLLANMRIELDEAERAYRTAERRYRDGSRFLEKAREDLAIARAAYDARLGELMADWDTLVRERVTSGVDLAPLGATPDQLELEIGALEKRREELRGRSNDILNDIGELKRLKLTEDQRVADLERIVSRRERLELEEPILSVGRITVVQEATMPVEVYADGRKKRAVAGTILGFGLSFGAFFLLGTIDRRTYGTAQIGIENVNCLGVLPDLRRKSSDPEATDIASHCVHQIRNQIEVRRESDEPYAVAVTSPHQGDGKTSVVMALGWSYAAAGYETILVDCDLVGRSLTRQLGLTGQPGLKEVMLNGLPNGEVVSLPVSNLSALPAGLDAAFGPEAVRGKDLGELLTELRKKFDMIIVDTGPLLGSLESTPVVTVCDGVVVLARRGRSRNRLNDVVERLRACGATCLGVVLNGAVRSECDRYVSEASLAAADHREEVKPRPGSDNALMLAMESTRPREQGPDDHDQAA